MTQLTDAPTPLSPVLRADDRPLPSLLPTGDRSRLDRVLVHLGAICLVMAVAWLAHFSLSRNMGFYSDDYTFSVPPLSYTPADMWNTTRTLMCTFPEPQGRPLGFWLGYILPYVGYRAGGMTGMFVISWLILSLNAVLIYSLLGRTMAGPIPILSAIFFVLFPADTNRPFLCTAHILQPALTFTLIGAHLYLWSRRWKWWAAPIYLLVAASLLTYESGMLPILAIPLLEKDRDRLWRRRAVTHVGCVIGVIGAMYLARTLMGEYRTGQANGSKLLTIGEIIAGTIIGPDACIHACQYRSWQGWMDFVWKRPHARAIFAPGLGACLLLSWLLARQVFAKPIRWTGKVVAVPDTVRAFLFGCAIVVVSYLFSFTHFPPALTEGQSTSTHLAAAIGGAIILASMVAFLWQLPLPTGVWRRIARPVGVLAAGWYVATLIMASIDEQDCYVQLWGQRQRFWVQVLDLCPDMGDGTLILCDGMMQPQQSWFLPAISWSDSLVPSQVYKFPTEFLRPPELQPFNSEPKAIKWYDGLRNDGTGHLCWFSADSQFRPYGSQHLPGEPLVEGKTILIHVDSIGHVTRQGGVVRIDGVNFHMKDVVPRQKPPFVTRPLYSILTGLPSVTK